MGCVGMSKIIGITGKMGAGKTYIGRQIQKKLKNSYFLEVDEFRRNLLKNNNQYREKLENALKLKGNWTGKELNEVIYRNLEAMKKYKKILYEFLILEIKHCNYDYVLVEWVLLIQDNLLFLLDALVLVDASYETRLRRICNIDLSLEDIKVRMNLQECENLEEMIEQYKSENKQFQYFKILNEKEGENDAMYVSYS